MAKPGGEEIGNTSKYISRSAGAGRQRIQDRTGPVVLPQVEK